MTPTRLPIHPRTFLWGESSIRPFRVIPAVVATACASRSLPQPPIPREATTVQASAGRTWNAVIDAFAVQNIPIRTIERASGLIVTDPLSIAGGDGQDWADCGKLNHLFLLPDNATYNVLVRGDSTRSTVKATVRWTHWMEADRTHAECSTTHVWEREFEGEIKRRAEERMTAAGATVDLGAVAPSDSAPPTGTQQPHTATSSTPSETTRAGPVPRVTIRQPRTPTVTSKLPRSNAELLREPDFSLAVEDCLRLGLILSYGESARDTLVVQLTDAAMTSSSTEYNLERLFDGYQRANWGRVTSVLELHHQGARVGGYSRTGLTRSNWR